MKDFLKFNSDKSFVHEITYLTDAQVSLRKNNHKKRLLTVLQTIQNNKWYNPQGKDISKKIKAVKIKNHNFEQYFNILKNILENK